MPTLKSCVVATVLVALVALGVAGGAVAQSGRDDVQQQIQSALSHGDISAALALFTDDAVIDAQSGLCADNPCVGKDAIRKDLERLAADKTRRITVLNTYAAGNMLVTRFEARSATIEKAGFERIVLWSIREMRDGKIASIRCCLPERTDSQTARFVQWEEQHPAVGQ